jgi:Protein of unknown function (DUF2914)
VNSTKTLSLAIFLGLLSASFYLWAADEDHPAATGDQSQIESNSGADGVTHAVPATGQVVRALFTTDVKNHEPVDTVSSLGNDKIRVSYFTEIIGMAGQTVKHRWEYKGKVLLEMPFKVGSSHWRIYSTKTLDPSWLGEWKASVVDANGGSLSVNTFTYMKAAAPLSTSATKIKQLP